MKTEKEKQELFEHQVKSCGWEKELKPVYKHGWHNGYGAAETYYEEILTKIKSLDIEGQISDFISDTNGEVESLFLAEKIKSFIESQLQTQSTLNPPTN